MSSVTLSQFILPLIGLMKRWQRKVTGYQQKLNKRKGAMPLIILSHTATYPFLQIQ